MSERESYEFEIQYVPLPSAKRAEWQQAMELLNRIILQAVSERCEVREKREMDEPVFVNPLAVPGAGSGH